MEPIVECAWFLLLLVLIAIPVGALILAIQGSARIKALIARVDTMEGELRSLRRERAAPAAEPAAVAPVPPEPAEAEEPTTTPVRPKPPSPAPPAPEPPPPPAEPIAPPQPRPSLFSAREIEKQLGSRLPVWIGAVALALAVAFLVKLSFDRGWLGPPVRVAMGVLFGIALLAAGERLRTSAARVAVGLSAAGIAILFVSFYAGVNLYALIPAVAGFLLMALTTATAVALSLRQGPMVAVLGLVGGFLTPYLVSPGEPEPRILFLYLLLLQTGLLAVSRRRGWWPLAALSFGGGLLWLVFWLTEAFRPAHEPWLGLFVLVSVALFAGAGATAGATTSRAFRERTDELNWLAALGGLVALAGLVVRAEYGPLAWLFLAVHGAGCLALARLEARFQPLAWVGAGVPALLLAAWIQGLEPGHGGRFLWTALALGALFALGAWAAIWRSPQADRWGWLAATSGVGYLLLGFWGTSSLDMELPWGGICIGLALVYLLACLPVAHRRGRAAELEGALAALAVAVTAFVSLAVPIELEHEWLAVAWAVEVAALVWLAGQLRIPILTRLAWVLGAAVAVRLLLNPFVLDYPIGRHPILNWLTYGYGIPVLAFAVAAWLATRQEEHRLSEGLQWGGLGLGTALLTLLVRQYFHPGEPGAPRFLLTEWGTITVAWLLLAWGLLAAGRRWPMRSLAWFAQGLTVAALGQAALGQVLTANPIWSHQAVGSPPVVNWLLWVYGAPAVLLVLLARELRAREWRLWLPIVCRIAALLLLFLVVTLEVRQAFRGSYLDQGAASGAEQYAYSAAWIVLGMALLAAGIAGRGRLLRFASLAVMLLAVGKVFLYDMAELRDFYRVFSFLGLGLSLLFIAWLYQRFVFRE